MTRGDLVTINDDRTCHAPEAAIDPIQAEFMQLYPPDAYHAMTPGEQAHAWANFMQSKKLQAQHAANHQSVQATVLIIFVVIPVIIGFIVFIVMGARGRSVRCESAGHCLYEYYRRAILLSREPA